MHARLENWRDEFIDLEQPFFVEALFDRHPEREHFGNRSGRRLL